MQYKRKLTRYFYKLHSYRQNKQTTSINTINNTQNNKFEVLRFLASYWSHNSVSLPWDFLYM
jgi:hypothetical protein